MIRFFIFDDDFLLGNVVSPDDIEKCKTFPGKRSDGGGRNSWSYNNHTVTINFHGCFWQFNGTKEFISSNRSPASTTRTAFNKHEWEATDFFFQTRRAIWKWRFRIHFVGTSISFLHFAIWESKVNQFRQICRTTFICILWKKYRMQYLSTFHFNDNFSWYLSREIQFLL